LLAGLHAEAALLHASFLDAWREFGILPEMFSYDLMEIDPSDPG